MSGGGFTAAERRFLAGLTALLGLRQFVLLLALPFISIYGTTLQGSTPFLIGLALGIYGLLQGLLQVPFGLCSDRFGRKNLILAGTLLLVAGLALATVAENIFTFIMARALQGVGAVTGVAYAWIADATPPEKRSRAMGLASLATGLAAVLSFIGGPLLYRVLSLANIFLLCAVLAGLVWLCVLLGVPAGQRRAADSKAPVAMSSLLRHRALKLFTVAGFLLNYIMMSFVFVLPLLADDVLGARNLWKILIPATIAGVLAMRLATRAADADHFNRVVCIAFAAFLPCALGFLISNSIAMLCAAMFFMAGYFSLTALLPAGVTRAVDERIYGSASGLFQSAQFLGAFAGGTASGFLWQFHPGASLGALAVAAGAGLLVCLRLSGSALAGNTEVTACSSGG